MFCSNCGTKVTAQDVFCPECGCRIEHPQTIAQEVREPVVIPAPEAPVTPAAAFEPEPAAPKKKSKKGLIIGVVAAVVALALAAAVVFWLLPTLRGSETKGGVEPTVAPTVEPTAPPTVAPKDAIAEARARMESAGSFRMELSLELGMSVSAMGQTQRMEMSMDYCFDVEKDPQRMYGTIRANVLGQSTSAEMYSEVVDGTTVVYTSTDGGAHWSQSAGAAAGTVDEEKLVRLFLEHGDLFTRTGTETINGRTATVYSCELDGAFIEDVFDSTGMMDSLGQLGSVPEDFLKDLGTIPLTVSIDDETGYPVHYAMDMTECYRNLYQKLMQQLLEQNGLGGMSIDVDMDVCKVDVVFSKINETGVEIPEGIR